MMLRGGRRTLSILTSRVAYCTNFYIEPHMYNYYYKIFKDCFFYCVEALNIAYGILWRFSPEAIYTTILRGRCLILQDAFFHDTQNKMRVKERIYCYCSNLHYYTYMELSCLSERGRASIFWSSSEDSDPTPLSSGVWEGRD